MFSDHPTLLHPGKMTSLLAMGMVNTEHISHASDKAVKRIPIALTARQEDEENSVRSSEHLMYIFMSDKRRLCL